MTYSSSLGTGSGRSVTWSSAGLCGHGEIRVSSQPNVAILFAFGPMRCQRWKKLVEAYLYVFLDFNAAHLGRFQQDNGQKQWMGKEDER